MSKHLLLLAALLIATLACGGQAAPSPEALDTVVAGTLTAIAPPPSTATPLPSPTATPTPTPKPAAVYVLDGDAWYWQPDVAPIQLTTLGQVEEALLSPDGTRVAIFRLVDEINSEFWVVNTDGSDLRQLLAPADFNQPPMPEGALAKAPWQIAWIPGTHTLAYSTLVLHEGPGLITSDDLHLVNADTGERQTLLPAGEGGVFSFSPDGQMLAISLPSRVDLLYLDQRQPRWTVMTYPPVLTYSEYTFRLSPQWAPDSSHLLAWLPPEDPLAEIQPPSAVWYLPTDGAPAYAIAQFTPVRFWFNQNRSALFSSDLSLVAYVALEGDQQSLHLAAVDGSRDVAYTTTPISGGMTNAPRITFMGWQPGTNRFVYALNDDPPLLGEIDHDPIPMAANGMTRANKIYWLTENEYLFVRGEWENWELRYASLDGANQLLAVSTSGPPPALDTLP